MEDMEEPGTEQESKSQVFPGPTVGKWESVKNPYQSPEVILESKVNWLLLGLELVVMGSGFLEEVLAIPEYQGPRQTLCSQLGFCYLFLNA